MNIEFSNIPSFEPKKVDLPEAPFLSYKPHFEKIKQAAAEFSAFKNLIVIGHGGSISSFLGMRSAFNLNKNVFILNTVDPEYITQLKNTLQKEETLVITISKSGENITQLEETLQFIDYPLLFITAKGTVLEQIGKKAGAKIIEHPPIGGRYTAFTEVALVPAAIYGIDTEKMFAGAKRMYESYFDENNIAMQAAQTFYYLEQQGFVDVFMPFYSHNLFPFSHLIVQLCHESFGKEGKGQTYLASEAPESQHHTNQRFFGGRKNIAGFFIYLENFRNELLTKMPTEMHSITIKDGTLFNLNKLPLSYSMQSEFRGTYEDAKIAGIPVAALNLNFINEEQIGAFIAFWQMYAVYSSVLRQVNPFDQPQVESSKIISWKRRRQFRQPGF
jgi:glucose-6-phosphate isomerase